MWGLLEQSIRFEDEDVTLVLDNHFNKIRHLHRFFTKLGEINVGNDQVCLG